MDIDGTNAILGRLASQVAKKLLKGESVRIYNAGKIIITGDRQKIEQKFLERRARGSPQHGPFFPSKPEAIVRRSVRGMLPKNRRGREALRKLRVHAEPPKKEAEKVGAKPIRTKYTTIEKISKAIG